MHVTDQCVVVTITLFATMSSFSIRAFFMITYKLVTLTLLQLCHAGGEGRQEKTYSE